MRKIFNKNHKKVIKELKKIETDSERMNILIDRLIKKNKQELSIFPGKEK
jgi:hypothetical protein